MFSRKLTRPLAAAAAAIAIAGGAYGIVGATAGNGSACSTATTPPRQHQPCPAAGVPTLGPDRPQGDIRHGRQRVQVELHAHRRQRVRR